MRNETPWTDAEIERMHQLYVVEGKSLKLTGAALNRSKNEITGKIARLRKSEGTERWPERGSPLPTASATRWGSEGNRAARRQLSEQRRAAREGTRSTLPPLASEA